MSIPNTPNTEAAQPAAEPLAAPVAAEGVAAVAAPAAAHTAAPQVAATAETSVLPPVPAAPTAYTAPAPAAAPTAAPAQSAAPVESDSNTLSITSFVLGLCSIVLGWTFVAPAVGLVLGIIARKREPRGRTFANWGIGLNAAMLALTVLALIAFIVFAAVFVPLIVASEGLYYVS